MLDLPPELDSTLAVRRAARSAKGAVMAAEDPLDDERDQGEGDGSIKDRAANGEGSEPDGPLIAEFGGVQLGLNVGAYVSNRNAKKVSEAGIVIQGGAQAVDTLLDVDTEYELLVRVLPDAPQPTCDRDSSRKTKGFKMRQPCQALMVRRADTAEAVIELIQSMAARDQVATQKLVRDLGEVVKGAAAA
jgi:hypothetical protein